MSSIAIVTPVTRQVIQRTSTTQGSIAMTGTCSGISDGQHVQAQFNGGSWTRIATVSSNTWSGTLSAQTAGQGTLGARWEESTATNTSVALVGVGDVFSCGGQSNMVGQGDNGQVYSNGAGLTASYSPLGGGSWGDLTESAGNGSFRPPLATQIMARTRLPVGFIMCAASGTAIASWLPSDSGNTYNVYIKGGTLTAAPSGTRAFLWWQGESDAIGGTSQATYDADLDIIINAVQSDLGVKTMPCELQTMSSGTASLPNQLAIRNAISAVCGDNANAMTGPDLSPISVGLHLTTDGQLLSAATYWFNALVSAGLLPIQGSGNISNVFSSVVH